MPGCGKMITCYTEKPSSKNLVFSNLFSYNFPVRPPLQISDFFHYFKSYNH